MIGNLGPIVRANMQSLIVGVLKLVVLTVAVYLAFTGILAALSSKAPSAKDLCDRVQLGTTIEQIEAATSSFQEWYILRDDGTFVVSAHPHYSSSVVCRIAIDPGSQRATSKSLGPLQRGDWPTL